ncbi:MAG: type II toxin-antitoxin system HicB family antitoxin [Anaerolineae bacterium]
MNSEQKTDRYDDSRVRERTLKDRERLRATGVEEPAPNLAAVAAQWKARQAAGEEAGALKPYRFVTIVQPEDGQFRAYAPTLDGCEARGSTPEEAKKQLLQALYVRLIEMLGGGQMPPSDEDAEIVNVVLPTSS